MTGRASIRFGQIRLERTLQAEEALYAVFIFIAVIVVLADVVDGQLRRQVLDDLAVECFVLAM
ncbi:hypothetical protein [Rhizobium sullae]|uniref:hypothetical protein n=1 Tax=Rhizobium sullae TaxID=50338 RepID=UPI001046B124|nr:hypothetical protein [Rhizobium sullae]